jgi:hypothetical protein
MAWNALIRCSFVQGEVAVRVTGHAGDIAAHEGLVRMDVVGLRGAITGGMAIQAAWMREHLCRLGEDCARPLGGIGD